VAGARKRTPEQVDAVAQGRVWTGAQALQHGLVDRLGSYRDALDSAARRGRLAQADSGQFRITYLDRQPERLQQLLDLLGGSVRQQLQEAVAGGALAAVPPTEMLWAADLLRQRQPYALTLHCLCTDP
jgi:protease-4